MLKESVHAEQIKNNKKERIENTGDTDVLLLY